MNSDAPPLQTELTAGLNKNRDQDRFNTETEQGLGFTLDFLTFWSSIHQGTELVDESKSSKVWYNYFWFFLWFFSKIFSVFLWIFSQLFSGFTCRLWTTRREKMMFYNIRSCFSWGFHSAQSKAEKGHVESSFSTSNSKLLSFPSQEESCKQLVTIMWLN